MKRYVQADSAPRGVQSFTLFDMLHTFSRVDEINLQNNEGSIWSGTVKEFNEFDEGDYFTDNAGYEFEKDQLMAATVSLIRPYQNVLIIGLDL